MAKKWERRRARLVNDNRTSKKLALRNVGKKFLDNLDEYRKVANINDYDPVRWNHWDIDQYNMDTFFHYSHHIDMDHAYISVEMENYEPYLRSIEYNDTKVEEYEYACSIMYMMTFDLVTKYMMTERSLVTRTNYSEIYEVIQYISTEMYRRFIKKGKSIKKGSFSGLLSVSYGPLYYNYIHGLRDVGLTPIPDENDTLQDTELIDIMNRSSNLVYDIYDNPESVLMTYEELYDNIGSTVVSLVMEDSIWKEGTDTNTLLKQSLLISLNKGKAVCYGLPDSYLDHVKHLMNMCSVRLMDALVLIMKDNRGVLTNPYDYDSQLNEIESNARMSVDSYISYRTR